MSGKGRITRACLSVVSAGTLLVAGPVAAQAPRSGLEVVTAGKRAIELMPSDHASVPFRVISTGDLRGEVAIGIDVPTGWRVIVPPDVQLPGDSAALRVLSFFVPADAPAGSHVVRLRAESNDRPLAIDSVIVNVTQHVQVEVEIEEAPAWISPSDTFRVGFRVMNEGNTALDIELKLEGSLGLRLDPEAPASRRLAAGESSIVEAEGTSRSSEAAAASHTVQLTAWASGDTAMAAARVQVVDQGLARGVDRGHALPAEVRLRVSENSRELPAVRISAGGLLRPGGSTHAELLIQGPHMGHSIYSQRDVYRFSLQSHAFSLRLGDSVYALSPLTEAGREGAGAAAGLRAGPLEAGGFVQRDRRSGTGSEQHAAFTRLHIGKVAAVGANWLHHEDAFLGTRNVMSAQGTLRAPGNWFIADGEYGSRLDQAAHAFAAHVRAGTKAFSVQLRRMRADSAYGSAYAGVMLDAAHVTVRPWRELFLEASAEERGSDRVVGGSVLSHGEQSARLALGYGSVVAEARYYSAARTSPWAVTDRTARSAGIRLRLRLGRLALVPRLEAGRSMDRLTGESGTFWRGSSQASVTTLSGTYTAAVEYFSGGTLHTISSGKGATASLSASVRPTELTRLTLSANGTRYTGDQSYTSLLANASLEQQLPFGHSIALRGSLRGIGGVFETRETVFLLDYTIPLRVPLTGSRASGSVSGRIDDGESGAPVERVIVEIGDRRAATNAQGYFEIRGLAAGNHHLRLDRSTIGMNRVPSKVLPAALEIRSGSTAVLDIALVPAARLEGRVVLVRQSAAAVAAGVGSQSAPEGLSGAIIELSRGGELVRRTVDEQGRFFVSDLRPGRWAVTVTRVRLPQHYHFERDTVMIEARSGEHIAVELRAVGRERRIQMIASADLTVTDDAPDTQPQTPAAARPSIPKPALSPHPPRHTHSQSGVEPVPSKAPLPPGWTLYTVPSYVRTLRGVARETYLETGLWPKIWLANRDSIPDPERIESETVLRIPPKAPLTNEEVFAMWRYMRSSWGLW